jgi:hypothetical protein
MHAFSLLGLFSNLVCISGYIGQNDLMLGEHTRILEMTRRGAVMALIRDTIQDCRGATEGN